jgi:hypothetical protein
MSMNINMHGIVLVEIDQIEDNRVPSGRPSYFRELRLVSEDGEELEITMFSDSPAKLFICYKNGPEPV